MAPKRKQARLWNALPAFHKHGEDHTRNVYQTVLIILVHPNLVPVPPQQYRTYAKAKPKAAGFMGANADGPVFSEKRRLIAEPDNSSGNDIPANFDGREAFPECASVIGRVRDQSDCGSCWAFASTEV